MGFIKKDRIPNPDKPGIYWDEDDKLNGIGYDDFEKFSLGSWNTSYRNEKLNLGYLQNEELLNKLFDPNQPPQRGRPVRMRFGTKEFRGGLLDPYAAPLGSYLVHVNNNNQIVNIVGKSGGGAHPEFRICNLSQIGVPASDPDQSTYENNQWNFDSFGNKRLIAPANNGGYIDKNGNYQDHRHTHYRQFKILQHYFDINHHGSVLPMQNGRYGEVILPNRELISYDDGEVYIQQKVSSRYERFEFKFPENILQKIQQLVHVFDLSEPIYDSLPNNLKSLDTIYPLFSALFSGEPNGADWNDPRYLYDIAGTGVLERPTHEIFFPRHFTIMHEDIEYVVGIDLFGDESFAGDGGSTDYWRSPRPGRILMGVLDDDRLYPKIPVDSDSFPFTVNIPDSATYSFNHPDTGENHTIQRVRHYHSPFIFPNSDDGSDIDRWELNPYHFSIAYPSTFHNGQKWSVESDWGAYQHIPDNNIMIFSPTVTDGMVEEGEVDGAESGFGEMSIYLQDSISTYFSSQLTSLGHRSDGEDLYKLQYRTDYTSEDNPYVQEVDFVVNTYINDLEKPLLFYDEETDDYQNTSFPLTVEVNLGLYNQSSTIDLDMVTPPDDYNEFLNQYYRGDYTAVDNFDDNPSESYYSYRVIQWGDEKKLLTDEELEERYYSKFYDEEDFEINEAPTTSNNYFYKLFAQTQKGAKHLTEKTKHTYITPGIKSIKILIFRYTKNGFYILSTTLLTKNIIINDGTITTQDFEIFGGTDYKFLPMGKNQIIVGGLDEDSKYVKSSRMINDKDQYGSGDYLNRGANKEFVKQLENGMWGKSPEKFDLGTLRTFSGVKRLENHIGDFNINSSSFDNTLVSNIFIDRVDNNVKRDVTMELNAEKRTFTTLQNTIGTSKTAILIGDYELEKKNEETPIRKKGIMNTSQTEINKTKQAI